MQIRNPKTIGNDLTFNCINDISTLIPRNFIRNQDEIFVVYSIEECNRKFYNETNKKTLSSSGEKTSQPIWDNQFRCFDIHMNEKNMYETNPYLCLAKKPYIVLHNNLYNLEKNMPVKTNDMGYIYFDDMRFRPDYGRVFYGKINEQEYCGSIYASEFHSFYYHNKNIYYLPCSADI